MKRTGLILLGLILLVLPLAACAEDDVAVQHNSRITAIETWKNAVEAQTGGAGLAQKLIEYNAAFAAKADSSNVYSRADVDAKINAISGSNSYSKAETYTKAEVDAMFAALKNDQSWITGGSSGSGTPSDTGVVVFTTNPVAIPQIFSSSSGGNSGPWILHIENQSTVWQYVKPVLNLNVASGQPSSLVSDITIMASCGLCSLTGSFVTPNNFSYSPVTMAATATPSIVAIPISGCNGSGEIHLGPGQSQDINMQIQGLTTPNPILWNVSQSISSRAQ